MCGKALSEHSSGRYCVAEKVQALEDGKPKGKPKGKAKKASGLSAGKRDDADFAAVLT